LGAAFGGVIRDTTGNAITRILPGGAWPPMAGGYITVYALEIVLLCVTLVAMVPLMRRTQANLAF
jgi:BCD family chlorophyll transporter-like MFS transporter